MMNTDNDARKTICFANKEFGFCCGSDCYWWICKSWENVDGKIMPKSGECELVKPISGGYK